MVFFILHAVPEVSLYVYHTLLMVRSVAVKACFVVMDKDPAKGFNGGSLDTGIDR